MKSYPIAPGEDMNCSYCQLKGNVLEFVALENDDDWLGEYDKEQQFDITYKGLFIADYRCVKCGEINNRWAQYRKEYGNGSIKDNPDIDLHQRLKNVLAQYLKQESISAKSSAEIARMLYYSNIRTQIQFIFKLEEQYPEDETE